MENENSWIKFIKSGKVSDYLSFVNSCKEKQIIDGTSNSLHYRGLSNQGNDSRGE